MEIIVLSIFVGLVIAFLAALEFYNIAEIKGHPKGKYFWYSFLLGIVGWLMVIALPDRRSAQQQSAPHEDEIPEL